MNNDIRNLTKWLNEGQEAPIDRQALARVLAMAEQPGHEQPFDHKAAANAALRDAQNRSYQVAKSTQPAQRTWVGLTDEQWQSIADTLGCIITRGQKDAIEAKLREKNQ